MGSLGRLSAVLQDRFHRPLQDLRISVTDRCNFRCGYCMPRDVYGPDHPYLPHSEILSFEEISRLASTFVELGVRKIRLTGGEPLLRKGLESLIAQLATLRTQTGAPIDLTLTTNGLLLARKAQALRDAGLQRITVSLDALDPHLFQKMSDTDWDVSTILDGIEAAQKVGLAPIKVNAVIQRGVNESQILPLARHFRGTGIELRFIEYMDVGSTNGWSMTHVVPSSETRAMIEAAFPLIPAQPSEDSSTAQTWHYADGQGSVGFISSVTQAFCSDCTRIRLSTDGKLYTCLFAIQGHDLRDLIRSGQSDASIHDAIRTLWQHRSDRYSETRNIRPVTVIPIVPAPGKRIEMSYIGG
ncbi:MAG TPA: GTP 3',8-cyclase MoaA [Aquabacterium sp.]|nr:GTP 3',8-cyclase MoaA [Aquabacterium sp.]